MTITAIKAVTAQTYALAPPYVDALEMVDPFTCVEDAGSNEEELYSWERYLTTDQNEVGNFVSFNSDEVYSLADYVVDEYTTCFDYNDYEYCQVF